MREVGLGLMLTAAFSACVNDPVGQAREEMERSRNAYMLCVNQNSETPATCNALKAEFDENMKAYMATTGPALAP